MGGPAQRRTCKHCLTMFDPNVPRACTSGCDSGKCEPKPRGFAAMSKEKVSAIASKGGKEAHAAGTAHQFSSDEARIAGKLGGRAHHVRRGRSARGPIVVTSPAPNPESASSPTEGE